MKKFYENPVVEITVFDVEDVITTSFAGQISTLDDAAAEQLIEAIEAGNVINNQNIIAAKKYNAYNW